MIAGLNADNAAAQELVRLVMELHGIAVEKMMEIIFSQGAAGAEVIEQLARDRVVSSLLVLHGLHPDNTEVRVARAVEKVAAQLRKQSVELQLLAIEEGRVRIQAKINAHACGSTQATVRSAIEEAVYEAAPEILSLSIEGLESAGSSGFVSLDKLVTVPAPLVGTGARD